MNFMNINPKNFIGQTVAEALKLMMLNYIAGKHLALSVDYIPYSSHFEVLFLSLFLIETDSSKFPKSI